MNTDSKPLCPPELPSSRKRNRPTDRGGVVDHEQNFFGRDFIEIRDRREADATLVHVAPRLDEQELRSPGPDCLPFRGMLPVRADIAGKGIRDDESDIVTG